ncbi:hypothetical protein ABZ858_07125 [Streptomyces sp. NPDC047017]|uniref:hypothetical protein n=1 Tax=Streptomyces sp. NPDC047017 TaxID=3155024 RepID=UPI003409D34F
MFGNRLRAVAVAAALLAGPAACGSSEDETPDPVSGLKDTARHVSRQTAQAVRPRLVRKCTTRTRQVRHTSSSGSGKERKTRTWYTTEDYQDCRKVRSGTEMYQEEVQPERWCVRLDDVDGDDSVDDVWYRVTSTDYDQALAADDHARLEFVPQQPDDGC